MKRVIIRCGCSVVVKTIDIDDGQKGMTKVEYAGECELCASNGGRYDLSPHWKGEEPKRWKK